ncbi:MAG: UxaA family hydrolase, partial [Chloroflexota bacterium]
SPFGRALRAITPGEYLCNAEVLAELNRRDLPFPLPAAPNFETAGAMYQLDEATFTPAEPLPRYDDMLMFEGYRRGAGRGVGTRNMIVLLGTSSLTGGFVRQLETRLQQHIPHHDHIDGIVAVAHTEGGHRSANNRDMVLRTLAGWMVHPNVGAVLAVDYGSEGINNAVLQAYLRDHNYPVDKVPHTFMSMSASFEEDMAQAAATVEAWLPAVNATPRTPQPISELKIALQCGGSDAFSGVSGNPLASHVAREVIRYGGSANLAETDELIGAEAYALDKVRDLATAQKFLATVERFKERVGYHGVSAEGNPSGGNKFRGLYNIYLKSLGAAVKRHPDVRLDAVIDYSERMTDPGFYFMDSPGNDLESIAGQVAAGCNMIFFVTGNGSITNFPFVPTIKIVTTTERFNLLAADMDVNAGAYLDGTPMDDMGADTLTLTRAVASGQLSAGEKAHHAQVQIWRDWQQTHTVNLTDIQPRDYTGQPLTIPPAENVPHIEIPVFETGEAPATEQIGLILPTSLCSGQIARQCVDKLNAELAGQAGISRFVTLVHTEGCGTSITTEYRTAQPNYLRHPNVRTALLLEHGCEMTHNAYFRGLMAENDLNPNDFGWASIQLDGGIGPVTERVVAYFREQLAQMHAAASTTAGLEAVRVGLVTSQALPDTEALALATFARWVVTAGGSAIIGEQDALLTGPFAAELGLHTPAPTLGYGQAITQPGFHIMAAPTPNWTETLTGLGATGVNALVAGVGEQAMPGHPMVPLVQASAQLPAADVYWPGGTATPAALLEAVVNTLAQRHAPLATTTGYTDFQITRGRLGVSL